MKLVFTSDLSGLGGGEVGITYLIEELSRHHTCFCICRLEGKLPSLLRDMSIDTLVVDYKDKKHLFSAIHVVRQQLLKWEPDAVFSNDPITSVLMGITLKGMRTKNYWICHGQWYEFDILRKSLINRLTNRVLCVSEATRAAMVVQGIKHCVVVGLGVPLQRFLLAKPAGLRAELAISSDVIIIATIARFQPIKGQLKGVKAVEKLLFDGINCVYLLVGGSIFGSKEDAAYEEQVRDYVFQNNLGSKILFLGERSDVPNLLKDVDYLLIPSDNESLGVVAIEAIMSGTTIVSTPNDGVSEVLEESSLFIAKANSSEALYQLLHSHIMGDYHPDEVASQLVEFRKQYDVKEIAKRIECAIDG